MARRMARRSFARRARKPVYWDTLDVALADLPAGSIAAADFIDGAFSSIRRYDDVGDQLINRTQVGFTMDATAVHSGTLALGSVLELCVGISIFDSMGDADGRAVNTTIVDGTGPLDDASNSRWYARCCVRIPIGALSLSLASTTENVVLPYDSPREYSRAYVVVMRRNSTNLEMSFHCEIDSKTKRKLAGAQSQFLQLACQARTNVTPVAGDRIDWTMNHFSGRHILTRR